MDAKQEIIRRYFRENDSERKIAGDLQINRKTVKIYLIEYLKVVKQTDKEQDHERIQEYCSLLTSNNTSGWFKVKFSQEVADIINEQLKENNRKKQEGLFKKIMRWFMII